MKKRQPMTKAKLSQGIKPLEPVAPAWRLAFECERRLHELQVHQVELETQNRELRDAQLLLEAARDRYANFYDFAPVGFVTFDDKGVIREINLTAAGMLGVTRTRLVGVRFHLHVVREDLARFRGHLANLPISDNHVATELRLRRNGDITIPVVMQSVRFYDAEKKGYLCRTALTDITARKQAEQLVRDNEARLHAVLDTAVDGIITIDERGTMESFNQAAVKLFGYSADEAIGRNVSLLMPSPHREAHARHLANYRDTGVRKVIGIGTEVLGRRQDGSTFPLEVSVSEVRLGARRIFTGIVRDITGRKQAEAALRESEDRFRTLFEASPIAVALHGADGRIIETNLRYQQMLGYTGKELRELGVKRITHPEDVAVGEQLYHELVDGTRDHYQREKRYCRKDGQVIWGVSTVSAIRTPEGRLRYIISAVEDITERRRTQAALRERQEIYSTIVDQAWDSIALVEVASGRMVEFNATAYQNLGYTREEFAALSVSDMDSALRPKTTLAFLARTFASGGGVFETRVRHKNGEWREVRVSSRPVRIRGCDYLAAIWSDITERKQLEREVLRIGAEERRRISHELHDGLGQTLTGIAFKAKALQGTLAQSASPLAQDLGEIATLVSGAIAESRRLAQGLDPIEIESAGLVAALAGLAAETQRLFGLACVFRCAEKDLSVPTATGAALYRISQEAVHNAISHGSPRTIEIELARSADQLRLCVQDDGKGFVPFETEGSGMGLHIMQHRAHAIGGTLTILSQPDQGTKIECFLPLEPAPVNRQKHR